MKTITVAQPYATLICAGVKTVENRSWSTKYRGEILIHSSAKWGGDFFEMPDLVIFQEYRRTVDFKDGHQIGDSEFLDLTVDGVLGLRKEGEPHRREFELIKTELATQQDEDQTVFPVSSIVGKATISDMVERDGAYEWILTDPVLFDYPTYPVKGKLRLWNFESTLTSDDPKTMIRR